MVILFINGRQALAQDSVIKTMDSTKLSTEDSLSLEAFKDSIEDLLASQSYFQESLGFLSNNVYLGRKDTAATPYATAMFGYYHKSGLYATVSVSYLLASGENRIDLTSLEAGYTFQAGKFEGQATAMKSWYSNQSYNVKSEIQGTISFSAGYDFGFIKPLIVPYVNIGNKTDFATTFGLEHSFYFANNHLDITPSLNANGSTQNYYNSYYKKRKFSVIRKGVNVIVDGSRSGTVLNASQFKILDYEFSTPVNYTIKKWTFDFSPTYVVPVSPATLAITTIKGNAPPKTRVFTEKLSNTFFFQAGITYKF